MHRILSLALLLFAICNVARADELKSEEQLQPLAEEVMASVAKGDLDAAFTTMKPFVVIPTAEMDALIVNTRAQRGAAGARYGNAVGYECVDTQKVGRSLVKITCIEKTEKHALPWLFYFYKAPRGWVLNSFSWNDNLPALFY